MSRRRATLSLVVVVVFFFCATPVNAVVCPSPAYSYCYARCRSYYCEYIGDPCAICKQEPGGYGCASWISCRCCDFPP